MNEVLENLAGIALMFGAAIVVTIVIITDFLNKSVRKSYLKWGVIILLSVWQLGCWRAMSNFDTAFGYSADMKWYEIGFIAIVCAWIAVQLISYLKSKRHVQ